MYLYAVCTNLCRTNTNGGLAHEFIANVKAARTLPALRATTAHRRTNTRSPARPPAPEGGVRGGGQSDYPCLPVARSVTPLKTRCKEGVCLGNRRPRSPPSHSDLVSQES